MAQIVGTGPALRAQRRAAGPWHLSVPGWNVSRLTARLFLRFAAFAERDDLRRIDRFVVNLHLDNFAFFVDQIIDASRRFVFRIVKAVLLGHVAAPVTQQREGHADFFRPRAVAERALHALTQY